MNLADWPSTTLPNIMLLGVVGGAFGLGFVTGSLGVLWLNGRPSLRLNELNETPWEDGGQTFANEKAEQVKARGGNLDDPLLRRQP